MFEEGVGGDHSFIISFTLTSTTSLPKKVQKGKKNDNNEGSDKRMLSTRKD